MMLPDSPKIANKLCFTFKRHYISLDGMELVKNLCYAQVQQASCLCVTPYAYTTPTFNTPDYILPEYGEQFGHACLDR